MEQKLSEQNVGSSLPVPAIVASVIAIVVLVAGLGAWLLGRWAARRSDRGSTPIATGD